MNKIKAVFLAVMLVLTLYQAVNLYQYFERRAELQQRLILAEAEEQRLRLEQEQAHARALAQWQQEQKARERAIKQRKIHAIESEGTSTGTVKQVVQEPLLPPPPPPPPTVIEASLSDGIRVELQNDTSWQTILQLVFTVLATYLGLKLINKYVSKPEVA